MVGWRLQNAQRRRRCQLGAIDGGRSLGRRATDRDDYYLFQHHRNGVLSNDPRDIYRNSVISGMLTTRLR